MSVLFVLTPYILSHVGLEKYGVWSIVGVLISYFGLLDLGVGASYVKYISEYYAGRKYKEINEIVCTGIVFYLIFSIIVITAAFFAMPILVKILNIPGYLEGEAKKVILLGIGLFCFSNIMGSFSSIQSGLQRMDISVKVSIVASTVNIICVIFFLNKGYGLIGLIASSICSFVVGGIINIIAAYKLFPQLSIRAVYVTKSAFKKVFNFGYQMQVMRLSDIILFQTDRVIIAVFFGIKYVGIYQIGAAVVNYAREIPLFLLSAILPAASEIHARQEKERMKKLYIRGSKYLFFITTPIMMFLVVAASGIIRLWVGNGYEGARGITQILSVGYYANVVVGVAVIIAIGMGRLGIITRASLLTLLSGIILTVLFAKTIGFLGVAIATAIALLSGPVYFLKRFHALIEVGTYDYLKRIAIKPALSVLVSSCFYISLQNTTLVQSIGFKACFFLGASVFCIVYVAGVVGCGYFDDYDKKLIFSRFEKYYKQKRR